MEYKKWQVNFVENNLGKKFFLHGHEEKSFEEYPKQKKFNVPPSQFDFMMKCSTEELNLLISKVLNPEKFNN